VYYLYRTRRKKTLNHAFATKVNKNLKNLKISIAVLLLFSKLTKTNNSKLKVSTFTDP
jgi:hypothetical protein